MNEERYRPSFTRSELIAVTAAVKEKYPGTKLAAYMTMQEYKACAGISIPAYIPARSQSQKLGFSEETITPQSALRTISSEDIPGTPEYRYAHDEMSEEEQTEHMFKTMGVKKPTPEEDARALAEWERARTRTGKNSTTSTNLTTGELND